MENRAAVFTNAPQDVEVYRSSGWQPGSMLGWRHEADGSCRAWVRLAARGADDTAWIDLADVRLPQPDVLPSIEGASAPALRSVVRGARSWAAAGDTGTSELTATMNLFAVRDLTDSGDGSGPERRRGGGRRRAPDTDVRGTVVGDGARLEAPRAPAVEAASAPGRHRAPAAGAAGAGRHRAADTEIMAAVVADGRPAVDAPRRAVPATPSVFSGAAGCDEPDADLYTRPLRLATSVPQPRDGGWDGPLSGF
jgi:hypothetical protein